MKLRVLIIPIILILVSTFVVSCSESSPEDIINQYSNYFENGKFDKMYDLLSEKSKGNQTKEEFVKNTGLDPSDDETTKLIISQMMDSFKFEPIKSAVDGNEAYVETRITMPDFGQLFAYLFSELFTLAFSSEDLEKESNDLIVEYLKNNKLETVKVYRDIRLVYEDSWKIDINSFELFEVPELTGEEIGNPKENEENIDQEEVSQESKISDYNDRLSEFNSLLDQFNRHFTIVGSLMQVQSNEPTEIISVAEQIIAEFELWQDELSVISPPDFMLNIVDYFMDWTVAGIEFFTYSKENPVNYDIVTMDQLKGSLTSTLKKAADERDRIKLNFNNEAEELGIEVPFLNEEPSAEESTGSEKEVVSSTERGTKENPWPVGTEVNNGEIIWLITSANDIGNTLKSTNMFYDDKKTTGKFIKVEAYIKNISSGTIDTTFLTFKILDSTFREFSEFPESFAYIEGGDSLEIIEEINPGMEKKYIFIFEVPSDAKGFMFEASDLEYFLESKTYISLGF
jgi:hypothetical protein